MSNLLKLREDWKTIAKRAWSFRLIALSGILSGVEMALPLFTNDVPRGVFTIASILVSVIGLWARLAVQRNMP